MGTKGVGAFNELPGLKRQKVEIWKLFCCLDFTWNQNVLLIANFANVRSKNQEFFCYRHFAWNQIHGSVKKMEKIRENSLYLHLYHVHQCGNYGNSLTVLLYKVLKSWFDEIFLLWEIIFRFSTLHSVQWKLR